MIAELPLDRILSWYLDAGVDEAIGERPVDRFAAAAAPRPEPAAPPVQPRPGPAILPISLEIAGTAAHVAGECKSLDELKHALATFEGFSWKMFANALVFGDGNPDARIMCIGEAPGEDEDQAGLPFIGRSGKLLDRMLASIGLDRSSAYLTNVIPWRLPASGRKPGPEELAVCLPFVTRHIELVDPQILVLLGGVAAQALLARHEGINRVRGRWFEYSSPGLPRPVPALATFPPDYLLNTPEAKRAAWHDLLLIRKKLDARTS